MVGAGLAPALKARAVRDDYKAAALPLPCLRVSSKGSRFSMDLEDSTSKTGYSPPLFRKNVQG